MIFLQLLDCNLAKIISYSSESANNNWWIHIIYFIKETQDIAYAIGVILQLADLEKVVELENEL